MIAENRAVKIAMIVLLVIVVSTAFVGGRYMKSVSQNKKKFQQFHLLKLILQMCPMEFIRGNMMQGR